MSLIQKMLDFQKKVGAITKNSENPFFKSSYFNVNALIEEVKPILNELGILLLQPLISLEGRPAIETILADPESKEVKSWITILPENPDPQKMGGIITYFRRYALQSLLFLQAEDDDANSASQEPSSNTTTQSSSKICPVCAKKHSGKYDVCYACYLKKSVPAKTTTAVKKDPTQEELDIQNIPF